MDNDITLYDILPPVAGNTVQVVTTPILSAVDANFSVDNTRGYILQNGLLRCIIGRVIKTGGGAGLCRLNITDTRFTMAAQFSNEYPSGYASMGNFNVASVALKVYFNNLGTQLALSPAVSPAFNYNMPTGSYVCAFGIWYQQS